MASLGGGPAVFVDKDGTLIENIPYNVDSRRIRLMPGAGAALRLLQDHGYNVVVVSNQSGIARGYFVERDLVRVRSRIGQLLADEGVDLQGFYYCPHHPEGVVARYRMLCTCRKPAPGLLQLASGQLEIDLGASWMVGDILDDVEAGTRAGVRSVLLDAGGETEWRMGPKRQPNHVAHSWDEVAEQILHAGNLSQWQH